MKFLLYIFLLLTSNIVQANQILPAIILYDSGSNFSKGSLPRTDNWLELLCFKSDCKLQPIKLKFSTGKAENVVGDFEETDEIAFQESNKSTHSIAWFNNLDIKVGNVTTWYISTNTYKLSALGTSSLNKLNKWQMNWGLKPLNISRVVTAEYRFNYHLSDGIKKQSLFSHNKYCSSNGDCDQQPIMHWMGDLDHDNLIDFIISVEDNGCYYNQKLFLSSKAKLGEFVGLAADLSGRYAACGC